MPYEQLTSEERHVICHLKLFALSLREIARRLGLRIDHQLMVSELARVFRGNNDSAIHSHALRVRTHPIRHNYPSPTTTFVSFYYSAMHTGVLCAGCLSPSLFLTDLLGLWTESTVEN